jgi:hypothetical protein
MRLVIQRASDTRAPTAALGACIDQQPRLDRVTGPAIGSGEHHACHGRQRGAIAQAIKPRALQGGTAIAVIAVARLRGAMPVGVRRDVVTQTAQLLVDRLLLWLTARCDTDGERDVHGCPPAEAMAPARCRRCGP